MKFLFLLLIGVSAPTFAASSSVDRGVMSSVTKKININITITSKGGCKFRIVGDYNTWTGSFTGTVTASGPSPCPKDTWTFGLSIHDDGTADVYGENEFTQILKDEPETLHDLVEQIQSMN